MESKITGIKIYQTGSGAWMYEVWINNFRLPQRPFTYFSLDAAFEAAKREAIEYVPPPVKSWQERLTELKIKLGFDPEAI